MRVEQSIPKSDQVAERWLRTQGVKKPEKAVTSDSRLISESNVASAYDLFVEKEDLKADIVRRQRGVMEPKKPNQPSFSTVSEEWNSVLGGETPQNPLSLRQKFDLIRQGKVRSLLSSTDGTFQEVVNSSQERIEQIDGELDQLFSLPGMYDAFRADLSSQVRIRHEARDVRSLDTFAEQADLLALKLTREAQVQGRSLTTVERRVLQDNQMLKGEAIQKRGELVRNPEVFDQVRLLELQEYKQQLAKDRFGLTPSRKAYLEKIEQYWVEGKKVLLTGETGTGKTETINQASKLLFAVKPEYVTGHQDMSIYELLGKTGFRVQEGDVFRPAPLVRAMTGRNGQGQPFLFDEIDRAPNQAVMGIKTILNARPGEKGIKIQTDSNGSFDVGKDYAVSATANVKSEKYATATELDPAIVRVFDAPMNIDYMPPSEVYDLALSTLMDKRGGIPLSEADARTVLKNLCDAASWIQDAYQGRKVVTDPSGKFLTERGQAATGKAASLKKALLDPGRTLDMLKGWSSAQIKGKGFEDYLSQRVVEFINNGEYPEEDRYYLAEIFALKGFLKNRSAGELMVTGLTQQVLDAWSGSSGRKEAARSGVSYLPYDRVVRLDPYSKLKRPVSADAEDLLQEEEPVTVGGEKKKPDSSKFSEEEQREIEEGDKENWERILGSNVEVKPYPKFITHEIISNLERLGMEIMYVPGLNIGTLADLKKMGEERFLKELEKKYPKWRRYESLSDAERSDHGIHRNLEKSYWEKVKNGEVGFPKFSGTWMAVEKIPKPPYGTPYDESEITKLLGLTDRFNITWNNVESAIKERKGKILSEAGLPTDKEVRQLNVEEYNLLANWYKWGETNTYEWTNTEYRGPDEQRRLVAGGSGRGGAASVRWHNPGHSSGRIGFRLAVVLES